MKFNSTFKGLYTMVKWDSSVKCKDGSINANQSMWYFTLKERQKSYYHLNRCKEIIGQKSTSIYNKKVFNRLSEISQTKTWFHLYVQSNKVELKETEWINGYQELECWGNGKRLVKGHKPSVVRWISSSYLMHSMVTIVNNTILYTWKLLWKNTLNVLTMTRTTKKCVLCPCFGDVNALVKLLQQYGSLNWCKASLLTHVKYAVETRNIFCWVKSLCSRSCLLQGSNNTTCLVFIVHNT